MSEERVYGQNEATTGMADHNTAAFQIAQAIRSVNTATICRIEKCTVTGQVGPIGKVDVLPLVDMIDGIGQASKHVNVLSLPYLRLHAGSKAIIIDPKAGDLGLVVFADRDTSAVRKTKKQSPPGSRRHHNMADGMYVGTLLADAPTSYIQFEDDGTIVISPDNGTTVVKVKANDIKAYINGDYIEIKPGKIKANVASTPVVIQDGRIDLGADPAPLGIKLDGDIVSTVVFGKP